MPTIKRNAKPVRSLWTNRFRFTSDAPTYKPRSFVKGKLFSVKVVRVAPYVGDTRVVVIGIDTGDFIDEVRLDSHHPEGINALQGVTDIPKGGLILLELEADKKNDPRLRVKRAGYGQWVNARFIPSCGASWQEVRKKVLENALLHPAFEN